jgi:hypothetical protein
MTVAEALLAMTVDSPQCYKDLTKMDPQSLPLHFKRTVQACKTLHTDAAEPLQM